MSGPVLTSRSRAAILFDMDGVLVHSREAWFHLMDECGRVFRGRPITREEFAPSFGQSTAEDVAGFALSCTPEALDRYYAANFQRYAAAVRVDSDAHRVLDVLRARGTAMAVVTNTARALALELLRAAGLLHFFATVACADEVAHPKPAPDLVHHALAALGQPPAAACMVGDSRFDRGAARAAGVRFVGLGIDGDHRIERLAELPALLVECHRGFPTMISG